jgi:ornithine cyclodeaminase
MMPGASPQFGVVGAASIGEILSSHRNEVVTLVRDAYLAHHAGRTVNPDSYFLRFADKPTARIIALPARLHDERDVAGIKWIASFPENHGRGIARASATIVLNDMETGFPYACLEGSLISAARTAASAILAAEALHGGKRAATVAIVGAGPIAASHVDFLLGTGWDIGRFRVYDTVADRAAAFCLRLREGGCPAEPSCRVEDAVSGADLVLFATTAATPYLADAALFSPEQTVLHVSLRDLGVPVILSAQNVVDDVDHCLKAQTSTHLTEQATGGRDFIAGTIGDLLTGALAPDPSRVRIFTPFGLGVLDLAVARFVHDKAAGDGRLVAIDGFFPAS